MDLSGENDDGPFFNWRYSHFRWTGLELLVLAAMHQSLGTRTRDLDLLAQRDNAADKIYYCYSC